MRIYIITIAIFFAAMSCSRQVAKNISKGDVQTKEQSTKTDSTKETTLMTNEKAVHYGDTLNASLTFNKDKKKDIIESGGIKVEGTLNDLGNGQFTVDINAIAKPTSSTEKTTHQKTVDKGLSETKKVSKDSTYTVRDVNKKSKVSSTGIVSMLLIFVLIIAAVIYAYKKLAPPWMKIF